MHLIISIALGIALSALAYRFRKGIGLTILGCAAVFALAAFAASVPSMVSLLVGDVVFIALAVWLCLKPTADAGDVHPQS